MPDVVPVTRLIGIDLTWIVAIAAIAITAAAVFAWRAARVIGPHEESKPKRGT